MKKLISNSKGFTLVELMVVVGIIGILATIAIPNFRKYQAKSKTTEAKIQLSSLYTTMESMLLEYDAYGTCIQVGGFNPADDMPNRFYAIGFATAGGATENGEVLSNGLASCDSTLHGCGSTVQTGTNSCDYYQAGKAAAGVATPSTTVAGTSITASTFTAATAGKINSSDEDKWHMNSEKKLIHAAVGY